MDDFTKGSLLALVGALLGFLAGRWESWIDRRRSRRTLATSLLCELSVLNSIVRQIYKFGHPASLDYLAHPVLTGALANVTLFPPTTSSELTQLNAAVNSLSTQIDHIFKYKPQGHSGEMAEFNVKGNAFFLSEQISRVVPLLEAAGGIRPSLPDTRKLSSDSMPELPENPFNSYGELDE